MGTSLETLGMEKILEKSSPRLPVFDGAFLVKEVGLADHLVHGAEAHGSHHLAHFFGTKKK
jgi:hypothetical protein